MPLRTSLLSLTTLLTLGASVAFAADDPRVPGSPPNSRPNIGQGGVPIFRRLDANKDGQISKREFANAARKATQKAPGKMGARGGNGVGTRVFDRLDTDKNGALSPAEVEKLKQLRARRNGGR